MEFYNQCILQRPAAENVNNKEFQVTWIPEEYAIEGNYVRLKENGVWDKRRWFVVSVSKVQLTHNEVLEAMKFYKTHRKGSDV